MRIWLAKLANESPVDKYLKERKTLQYCRNSFFQVFHYLITLCFFPVSELKSKWKNLRTKMRKELLKMPKTKSGDPAAGWKSSWEFFDIMLFLKDVILPAPTTGNLVRRFENSEEDREDQTGDDSSLDGEESIREIRTPRTHVPVASPSPDCASSSRSSSVFSNRQNACREVRP